MRQSIVDRQAAFFWVKFELEDLFQQVVDLVSKTAILADPNHVRRQNILESARVISAAE